MTTVLKTDALAIAAQGRAIFPCKANEKRPLITDWGNQATSNREQIERWWTQWPEANIGLPTGRRNGFFVLDVDVKNGAKGLDSLKALTDEYGGLPKTPKVTTPSGGLHFFFVYDNQTPVRNKAGFLPGLDIRGEGGYVVAPPSLVDAKSYVWEVAFSDGIAACPVWLLDKIGTSASGHTDAVAIARRGAPEGTRNDSIFRYAASLVARGLPYADAKALVLRAAGECQPPLDDEEARQCLDSAYGRYAPSRPLTDLGNAERFVDRFGALARHVPNLTSWYTWNGLRWIRSDLGEINQYAKATIRGIRDEVSRESDVSKRDALQRHANKSESANSIQNLVKLAATEIGMSIHGEQLDKDGHLLGVQNGILNLKTGELMPPNPDNYITLTSAATFDPEATCPKWEAFLKDVTASDPEMIEFLQRCVGYSLLGGNPAQKLIVLYGLGANGKSTFLRAVQHLFGTYAKAVEGSLFMVQKNQSSGGAREDILRLRAARLIVSVELGEGYVLNEELVKRMTGDDTMTARGVYAKHSIEFTPSFTPWIATNHKPIVKGDDYAIWRRITLVPFDQQIPEDKRDPFLAAKLLKEISGILNWAVEGYKKWQKDQDLRIPSRVAAATSDYKSEMDLVEEWLEIHCDTGPEFRATTADLYESYKGYCQRTYESTSLGKNGFGRKLSSRGFAPTKVEGRRGFLGIGLNDSMDTFLSHQIATIDQRCRYG